MMQVAPQRLRTKTPSTQPDDEVVVVGSTRSKPADDCVPTTDGSETILQRRLSSAPVITGLPSTPTRTTFPFKPAAITPQGREFTMFRPRPVVPAFTPPSTRSQKVIHTQPQRCKSFSDLDDSPSRALKIEPPVPVWLTDFTGNMKRLRASTPSFSAEGVSQGDDIPLFPVSVDDDIWESNAEYWWLHDMANWGPLREKPTTTIRNFLMKLSKETIEIDNRATKQSINFIMDDEVKTKELDDALRDLLKLDGINRTLPEIASLHQQIIEIKRYIVSAHHLQDDRRELIHALLQNIESVITGSGSEGREETAEKATTIEEYYRKTKVGLQGGSLVTAGLILIPAPVIPGILVVYGGLLVLASEFDSAKTAVQTMQVPMKEFLKDEEDPNQGINDCFHSIMWEEMIGYSPVAKELDEDFEKIMRMKPWKDNQDTGVSDHNEIERAKRERKNAMKRYARQLLLLEKQEDGNVGQDEKTETRVENVSDDKEPLCSECEHSSPSLGINE